MSCVEFIFRHIVFFFRRERERFVTTVPLLSITHRRLPLEPAQHIEVSPLESKDIRRIKCL